MIRSQVYTSRPRSSLPARTSASLPRLPSSMECMPKAEILEKWMTRSSKPSTQSWSRPSTPVQRNKLGRPTNASMLRSKTCPAAEPCYKEQIRKKKMFEIRCKVLSAAMLSQTLPNGETFHGFLIGARYNSAITLDSYSLERCGVHVPRGDTEKLFVRHVGKKPPAKIFGNLVEGSRVVSGMPPGYPISRQSNPRLQPEPCVVDTKRIEDCCAGSIEHELDELFGPNEEGSCSGTTILPVCENLQDKNSDGLSYNFISTQVSASEDQIESNNLPTVISPTSRLLTKEDISQPSFSLSEDQREENEQDLISHEAHKLTQEILQESMYSFSRHNSIDPVNTNSTASSQPEATSIDLGSTNSTHPDTKNIDPSSASSQPEAKSVENKSLQISLEKMAYDECSNQDTNDSITCTMESIRPVSAVLSRKKNIVEWDSRPQSARLYSQNRTANSMVIDINLQSIEDS